MDCAEIDIFDSFDSFDLLELDTSPSSAFLAASILVRVGSSATRAMPSARSVGIHLLRLGRIMYPESTVAAIKQRALLMALVVSNLRDLQWWFGISDNPKLGVALQRFPLIEGAIQWPYIHCGWPMHRRLAAIDEHYRLLDGRALVIAVASNGVVDLVALDEPCPGLRLTLDKPPWFVREGEVVLNLFLHHERLFSLAFTLGRDPDDSPGRRGELVAYVGALQGSNATHALQTYRALTRALYGMRPRDFLLIAFRLLASAMGVDAIYAVTSAARHHNAAYFDGSHESKVVLDYDEVWSEQGGKRAANGFFELPVAIRRRHADEIPSRKRALYRRRYQMLDDLARAIESACARASRETPDALSD